MHKRDNEIYKQALKIFCFKVLVLTQPDHLILIEIFSLYTTSPTCTHSVQVVSEVQHGYNIKEHCNTIS